MLVVVFIVIVIAIMTYERLVPDDPEASYLGSEMNLEPEVIRDKDDE